jgi:GT2 family glycosyltransferase
LKRASVIIPNWNGQELLGPCLESLYRQDFSDFETILIDNGSRDGSVAFVRDHFPQVTIIGFGENRGFSAAVNAGILASEGRYIALLNNDTEIDRLWLKELVATLDANPEVGSVASKVLFHSDPHTVNSAGDEFSVFGVPYQRRLMRGDRDHFNEPRYVFSACGAAALYRRELFEKIGLFDEVFFAYQEDVDLGFRSQLAGYKCLYVPTAIVYHKYHTSLSKASNLWFYLKERNKYFVLVKNLSAKLWLICLPLILLQEALSLFEAIWRGHFAAYCKARKDLWSYLPYMLLERRRIRGFRTVDDDYIRRLLCFKEPMRIFFNQCCVAVPSCAERVRNDSRLPLS